jgi:hypothetical protein
MGREPHPTSVNTRSQRYFDRCTKTLIHTFVLAEPDYTDSFAY